MCGGNTGTEAAAGQEQNKFCIGKNKDDCKTDGIELEGNTLKVDVKYCNSQKTKLKDNYYLYYIKRNNLKERCQARGSETICDNNRFKIICNNK